MTDPRARFNELRDRFLIRCLEDRDTIARAQEGYTQPEILRFAVHRLAGAAGTFGFPDLSRVAAEIDDLLVEGKPVPDADFERLLNAIDAVLVH